MGAYLDCEGCPCNTKTYPCVGLLMGKCTGMVPFEPYLKAYREPEGLTLKWRKDIEMGKYWR